VILTRVTFAYGDSLMPMTFSRGLQMGRCTSPDEVETTRSCPAAQGGSWVIVAAKMTGMAMDTLTIVMPVSIWNGIDGGMDNKATNARWSYWDNGGDMGDDLNRPNAGPESIFAAAIREEGWRQLPGAWQQPGDEEVAVSLSREQWEFVMADARYGVDAYDELAQKATGHSKQEMLLSAALCRETLSVVGQALTADPHRPS
jgi:hypothetical protein